MGLFDDMPFIKQVIQLTYTLILIIVVSTLIGLVLAFPVMLLWNFVFGSALKINVFQAWALNVLAGILFGQRSSSKG